jgi:predicted Zn-dependent protease
LGALGGAVLDVLFAAGGVNTQGTFTDTGGDVGAAMFSRQFEAEADYVGLYFVERAGYSIGGVEEFWRRMAVDHPRGIRFAYTHPTTAERFLGLAAARDEILAKRAAGQPLTPNLRRAETQGAAPAPRR